MRFLLALLFCLSAQAQSWDASGDFSLSQNPNGQWSYGWHMLGGQFQPLTVQKDANHCGITGVPCWALLSGAVPIPEVGTNVTGAPILGQQPAGFFIIPIQTLYLRPGVTGEQASVKWTAADAGHYFVAASFQLTDQYPTGIYAVVSVNGLEQSKHVQGYGRTAQFKLELDLNRGDWVEFYIDPDSDWTYDSTQLRANILKE